MSENPRTVEDRLTKHGESIAALIIGQQSLTSGLKDLGDIVRIAADSQRTESSRTQDELRLIVSKFGELGRPNLALWVSAAMLAIVLIGAILWPVSESITELKAAQSTALAERKQSAIDRAVLAERMAWVDKWNANENSWIKKWTDAQIDWLGKLHDNDFKWQQDQQNLIHQDFDRRIQQPKSAAANQP